MKKRIPIFVVVICFAMGVIILPQASVKSATAVKAAQGGLPDLIVRSDVLRNHWLVRVEDLRPEFCSVQEGGITPGTRPLLRFTVTTPNIGTGDLVVGDPNVHFEADDGLFEFATCHHHFHFRHYAIYELIDPATGQVWRAAKRGFCMLDTDPNPQWLGGPNPGQPQFRNCGEIGFAGNQGISAGWADTYNFLLAGQFFVLDGGDGQPPVPPGTYVIRITVNPPFVARRREPCPQVDSNGFCHQLPESNYDNNVGETTIVIPARPGRTGVGPEAGAPHLNPEQFR
ncbi:MAG TPA: lysyl oxidase family protein [Blastocatellia bacterium]|nr:lysyl oxidase family protein [Blastocatellia bacterium]